MPACGALVQTCWVPGSDVPLWAVKQYEEVKRREEANTGKATPQREEIVEEPNANLAQLAAAGALDLPVFILSALGRFPVVCLG